MLFTEVRPVKRDIIPRANSLIMCQPVLFQYKGFFPFQEIEAVVAGFFDHQVQLLYRQRAHGTERVYPYAEQHLVLDDIAHTGKYLLCEQGIAHQHTRYFF